MQGRMDPAASTPQGTRAARFHASTPCRDEALAGQLASDPQPLTVVGVGTRLVGQVFYGLVFSSGVKSVDGCTILTTPADSLPQPPDLDIAL
jgi:hypothetical protein